MQLEATTVSVKIAKRSLLTDVSVAVRPGEVTALIGANGAGKTTLFRLLAGRSVPSEGSASIDGIDLRTISPRLLAQKRAVVAQSTKTSFELSVRDVISLGTLPWRRELRAHQTQALVLDAARSFEVEHLLSAPYATLSGGEAQRAQLARGRAQLGCEPAGRYFLLDEPTSDLDPAHVCGFMRQIRALAQDEGVGVLVILHDLNAAARCADHIVALESGRVIATGSPRSVLIPDVLRKTYGHGLHVLYDSDRLPVVIPHAARDQPAPSFSSPS